MMGSIYEANTLMTLREMTTVNAVDDPIWIRASRRLIMTVIAMEWRGKAERGSTCVRMDD